MNKSRTLEASVSITPKERLVRALRGEPVDRVPVWLMRQAGRYLPEYQAVRKNYEFLEMCKTPEAAAEVSVQPIEIVGSDAVIIFNDIMLPLENAGAQVEFTDRGPRINNPVRSGADLAALSTNAVQSSQPVVGTIEAVRERVGPDFPILGFVGAPWTLASYWVEGVMTKNYESIMSMRWGDPSTLDALLEHITEFATEYLRIQIEAGADGVQIFDSWGGILGAKDYERFSGKWIRKIIESVRDLDVPVIVYLNGVTPYLDTLKTLGADCISVDWRIGLEDARASLGDGVALQGNIDPLILYSNPDAIEAEVRRIFHDFPPQAGHVFNLGHGVLPKTPVENVRTLIEAVKQHGQC